MLPRQLHTECLVSGKHHAKCSTHMRQIPITVLFYKTRKLSRGKTHTPEDAHKWRNWDLNQGSLAPEPKHSTPTATSCSQCVSLLVILPLLKTEWRSFEAGALVLCCSSFTVPCLRLVKQQLLNKCFNWLKGQPSNFSNT